MWQKMVFRFMPRYELMRTNIEARKCFRMVIYWWCICGEVVFLVFELNWRSTSVERFVWHGRVMTMVICPSYQIIGILSYIQVAELFKYHLDDKALYKANTRMSSFPSVGWLHVTSRVPSRGHNLCYRCLFEAYNISFQSL